MDISGLESGKEDEFQYDLFKVVKRVKNADSFTVTRLIDIYEMSSAWVGSSVFDKIECPQPEAVSMLIKAYEKVNGRGQIDIIRALGTVSTTTQRIEDFLLRELKNKDGWIRGYAAKSLGDLDELCSEESTNEIFCELIRSAKTTAEAAISLGKRVEGFAALENNTRLGAEEIHEILVQAAKAQRRILQLPSRTYPFIPRISRHEESFNALSRVVSYFTSFRVIALPEKLNELPYPVVGGDETTIAPRPRVHSRFASNNQRVHTALLLVLATIYLVLQALLPDILTSFLPIQSLSSTGIRVGLTIVFLLLSFIAAWLWLHNNSNE